MDYEEGPRGAVPSTTLTVGAESRTRFRHFNSVFVDRLHDHESQVGKQANEEQSRREQTANNLGAPTFKCPANCNLQAISGSQPANN